jgi:hypothetical protein
VCLDVAGMFLSEEEKVYGAQFLARESELRGRFSRRKIGLRGVLESFVCVCLGQALYSCKCELRKSQAHFCMVRGAGYIYIHTYICMYLHVHAFVCTYV